MIHVVGCVRPVHFGILPDKMFNSSHANEAIFPNSIRIELSSTHRGSVLTDQRSVGIEQTCFVGADVGRYRPPPTERASVRLCANFVRVGASRVTCINGVGRKVGGWKPSGISVRVHPLMLVAGLPVFTLPESGLRVSVVPTTRSPSVAVHSPAVIMCTLFQ